MPALPLLIIGGGFAFTGSILYGAWLLGRYRGRDDELHPDVARIEIRLVQLEQTLSQTTSALSRLEAAHRQAILVMTEPSTPQLKLPGRPNTPH